MRHVFAGFFALVLLTGCFGRGKDPGPDASVISPTPDAADLVAADGTGIGETANPGGRPQAPTIDDSQDPKFDEWSQLPDKKRLFGGGRGSGSKGNTTGSSAANQQLRQAMRSRR